MKSILPRVDDTTTDYSNENMTDDIHIINDTNKDVICAAPWSHLYIDTEGLVRPCCTSDIVYGDSTTTSVTNIWHSPTANEFRKNLLDGKKQSGCTFCYNQEKHAGSSLRTALNQRYTDMISHNTSPMMIIKYLDIRSSNLCNMACIMCGVGYSSNWFDDEVALYGENRKYKSKFINITKKTENDVIDNILDNSIDLVYFAGGEPLITPYHYKLVDTMISMGIANNIDLRYNTNLSTLKYKSIDITERWSHFKSVELAPSIDMIGEHAEYHRYGTIWSKISENLHTVRYKMSNITVTPQITITALSVGYLPELFIYLTDELGFTDDDNIEYNLVFGSEKLHPQLLPNEVKKMYTNKLESFLENTPYPALFRGIVSSSISYMNEENKEKDFHLLVEYLDNLDEIRDNDWKSLWPELWGPV